MTMVLFPGMTLVDTEYHLSFGPDAFDARCRALNLHSAAMALAAINILLTESEMLLACARTAGTSFRPVITVRITVAGNKMSMHAGFSQHLSHQVPNTDYPVPQFAAWHNIHMLELKADGTWRDDSFQVLAPIGRGDKEDGLRDPLDELD